MELAGSESEAGLFLDLHCVVKLICFLKSAILDVLYVNVHGVLGGDRKLVIFCI